MKKISDRTLDTAFRKYIINRDGHKCVICDETKSLQCAHIFGRAVHSTRWEPDNALTLCLYCHDWGHHNVALFRRLAESIIGQDKLNRINRMYNRPVKLTEEQKQEKLELLRA